MATVTPRAGGRRRTRAATLGARAERAGLQNISAGHSTIGRWEAGFGPLFAFAALNVAYDLALPRLRDRAAS